MDYNIIINKAIELANVVVIDGIIHKTSVAPQEINSNTEKIVLISGGSIFFINFGAAEHDQIEPIMSEVNRAGRPYEFRYTNEVPHESVG